MPSNPSFLKILLLLEHCLVACFYFLLIWDLGYTLFSLTPDTIDFLLSFMNLSLAYFYRIFSISLSEIHTNIHLSTGMDPISIFRGKGGVAFWNRESKKAKKRSIAGNLIAVDKGKKKSKGKGVIC